MKVAILQSNYLPWRGYFDLIHDVDLFVLYDDVQFTKNDWRNRNRIYGPSGLQWLSVPVGGQIHRKICEVPIPDARWQEKHFRTLTQAYAKAPFLAGMRPWLESVFRERVWTSLSELNRVVICEVAEMLGIHTDIRDSREFSAEGDRVERLLSILGQVRATHYISGPAARAYLAGEENRFTEIGVDLSYKSYPDYPKYRQRREPFEPGVSVIDLLMNVGPMDAADYIWGKA